MVRAATQNLIAIGCLGAGFLTACSQGDPLDHLAQGETGRVVLQRPRPVGNIGARRDWSRGTHH